MVQILHYLFDIIIIPQYNKKVKSLGIVKIHYTLNWHSLNRMSYFHIVMFSSVYKDVKLAIIKTELYSFWQKVKKKPPTWHCRR